MDQRMYHWTEDRLYHKIVVGALMTVAVGVGLTLFLMNAQLAQQVRLPLVHVTPRSLPAANTAAPTAGAPDALTATAAAPPAVPAPVPAVASSQVPSSSDVAPTPANTTHKTASHHPARTSGSPLAAAPASTDSDSANRVAAASPPPPAPALPSGDGQPNASAAPAPGAGAAADATVAATPPPPASPPTTAAASDAETAGDAAPASDSAIAKAAQSEISADSSNSGANVAVTTQNGVVVLSGTVPSQEALNSVRAAAARVKDVKRVDSSAVTVTGS